MGRMEPAIAETSEWLVVLVSVPRRECATTGEDKHLLSFSHLPLPGVHVLSYSHLPLQWSGELLFCSKGPLSQRGVDPRPA
jgi:hypothetical protein